jgi:hypothetical protein
LSDTTFKWLLFGDLQIPYHDKRAVDLVFKVIEQWKPNAIDITGDVDDQLEYSRFSDGTTDEFFSVLNKMKLAEDESPESFAERKSPLSFVAECSNTTREFMHRVREKAGNADVHFSLGNHDCRVNSYVDRKMPEYNEFITPNFLWNLDDLGITYRSYELPPLERFAKIHVHHGNTTTTTGLAVKNDIEAYHISLARGHDHRGGVVYKTFPMTGQTLVGLGTGHLCDPSAYGLSYTMNPSWELGFGICNIYQNIPTMQFIPIQRGDQGYFCVVDGMVIKE